MNRVPVYIYLNRYSSLQKVVCQTKPTTKFICRNGKRDAPSVKNFNFLDLHDEVPKFLSYKFRVWIYVI